MPFSAQLMRVVTSHATARGRPGAHAAANRAVECALVSAVPRPFALRDYAFLADGQRGILVGPHGDMVWMCFPEWSSPSVFTALLGGEGCYQVAPTDERFVWGGYYDEGGLIWNDRWVTTTSVIECREALAFPGDRSRAVIMRRVKAVEGRADVTVRLDVRADFGRRRMQDIRQADGAWLGRSGATYLRWEPGPGAQALRGGGLCLRLELAPGEHRDLLLGLSTEPTTREIGPPDQLWQATKAHWAQSVPSMSGLPGQRDATHAYAVMRGMTTGAGGLVAAATTSLPERAEAGRNYDYRYAWIRDQCLAGEAVAALGRGQGLLDAWVHFVTERLRADGPELKPAYRTDGGPVPDDQELSHLPGYPGADVRTGNPVNRQFQLDAVGEALLLLAAAARQDRLDGSHWKAAEIAVDVIARRWEEPDSGIWELAPRWWTHSRLICVAGLHRISVDATAAQAREWTALADTIAAETARTCVHPSGRWQRATDDERVDAALLLPPVRGGTSVDDPRTIATLASVEQELCRDGYVYRFRHDERPLHEAEGAFSLCGFALCLAHLQQGDRQRAVSLFERTRASCGPPGLLTEELDVGERQLRGNIPQAFVHAALLECAVRLAMSEDGAEGRPRADRSPVDAGPQAG
jgi:hypothetical protein